MSDPPPGGSDLPVQPIDLRLAPLPPEPPFEE